MFVSTNVRFLENDYMMTNKPSSEVDWRALDVTTTLVENTVETTQTIPNSSALGPYHNERVVMQPV